MVLVTHGAGAHREELLYPLWIDQAVPMFLILQTFHVYKKGEVQYPKFTKLWKRIIRPFLLIQCVFLAYYLLKSFICDINLQDCLWEMFKSGGSGPGSYYPWIYLQIALLCPLLARLVKNKYRLWWFVGLCIVSELFCSMVNMDESLYRLLCLRYIFLFPLGYLWVKQGIVLSPATIIFSACSAASILYLNYVHQQSTGITFEPWVFDTDWVSFHWFCYAIAWSVLPYIICRMYQLKPQWLINRLILLCGKRSYEIFLFQMLVFGLMPTGGKLNIIISLLPVLFYEWRDFRAMIKH